MRPMPDERASLWSEVERAQERALEDEVDLSLIESNLALTPRERLERHDRAAALLRALRDAAARTDER